MKFLIADSAVSLAPVEWRSNKKINQYYQKFKRMPVIDGSTHQHLQKDIPLSERQDRPDILHLGLLTILGYREFLPAFELQFSTHSDKWFTVKSNTQLPRSQPRFYGILEQLLSDKYNGEYIQKIPKYKLPDTSTLLFSSNARPLQPSDFTTHDIFVFGGFAHGTFRSLKEDNFDTVSLSPHNLDLWTALSRFINQLHDFMYPDKSIRRS